MPNKADCRHIDTVQRVPPASRVCDECVAMGDRWVHLRACLNCGHVGCCDYSKNKHATKHFHATGHPLIQSIEPGESWIYCYVDEVTIEG
ncbi:MAG TPA: UBP-type zinc finger domain-containing protein [Gemmatimonadaceae bacterium]|nr:UBP-type zinc finger domain-containing protein [Gemmatimonadaceae bacterium]